MVLRGVRLVKPPQTNATLVAVYPVTKAAEWNSGRTQGPARWTGRERFYLRTKTVRETTGTSEDSASNRNIKFIAEVRKTRQAFMEQAARSVKPQENEIVEFIFDGESEPQTARVLAVDVTRSGHLPATRHLQLQTA